MAEHADYVFFFELPECVSEFAFVDGGGLLDILGFFVLVVDEFKQVVVVHPVLGDLLLEVDGYLLNNLSDQSGFLLGGH